MHDIAVLLLDTGLRIGQALNLQSMNIHIAPADGAKYGYVRVRPRTSKNSKGRNVPLASRVADMLAGRVEGEGLIFRRKDGTRLCQTWLNEQHRDIRVLLKLDSEFVPHSFRHTFGTRLGEAGADAFTIMKLMGHSSITMSQKYVHPSPPACEAAIGRMEVLNQAKGGHTIGIPAVRSASLRQ